LFREDWGGRRGDGGGWKKKEGHEFLFSDSIIVDFSAVGNPKTNGI
jgi:hypothetical protein